MDLPFLFLCLCLKILTSMNPFFSCQEVGHCYGRRHDFKVNHVYELRSVYVLRFKVCRQRGWKRQVFFLDNLQIESIQNKFKFWIYYVTPLNKTQLTYKGKIK